MFSMKRLNNRVCQQQKRSFWNSKRKRLPLIFLWNWI